ncbi:type I toxin-antitoxin system SymE family toxin [Enterobacter cloacae]|nr:type I toxin-antitoxin system SymE family toxin [Enterobacter cloacae]
MAPVSHFSPTLLKSLYVSIRHFYRHNYTATWYSRSPSLRLNGNWLEEAGFSTDTPFMVSVEQGKLVIEPVKG